MTFSYDGNRYKGYQKQQDELTIQGSIEEALKTINNDEKVLIFASGRTDTKVHALNQKAHFDLNLDIPCENLKTALNSLLPDDIFVKDIQIVNRNFHARFDAKAKEYIYLINMGEYNPLERNYIYQYNKRLDIVEMERALKYLEGRHNFKSFSKTNDEKEDFERVIVQTNLIRDFKNINKITISFVGTGFLRYMVRNMVGTLIEIGEGKKRSEDIINILKAEDRNCAGKTANPEGLYLKDVFY